MDSFLPPTAAPLPWAASAPVANPAAVFARLPRNNSATRTADNFPHAEMVLINTRTQGISPEGWGPVEKAPGFDSSQVRFWEFNTTDLQGKPVDVSRRHPVSRQLTLEKDAALIADYKRPEIEQGGWKPLVQRGGETVASAGCAAAGGVGRGRAGDRTVGHP